MEFKDYYATLGVPRTARPEEIKRAYRKLARQFHPDVSQEAHAEARFKEVAEAHEALIDPERRASYDDILQRHDRGESFEPPSGWDPGPQAAGRPFHPQSPDDFSEFFEKLFGRRGHPSQPARAAQGEDLHAQVVIDLIDAYRGARRTLGLRVPVSDAEGRHGLRQRQLEVQIPKGVRAGQQLRLAGQGAAGHHGGASGDLYLEIQFRPDPVFRVDGRDVSFDLPMAPWEAVLGATVQVPTPEGPVQLDIPPGSQPGQKLRLKGRGLPGVPAGDLYAVLRLVLPSSVAPAEQAAWQELSRAFPGYDPRGPLHQPA